MKPAELNKTENSSVGNFSSIASAGLFLASFAAKLPLNISGITDIYGKSRHSLCHQKLKLGEALLMSTHNKCFHREIRKHIDTFCLK